ncbi:glutathione S- transferase, nitrogen catabolite repression regulator, partial [Onygenales sp. PD_40]
MLGQPVIILEELGLAYELELLSWQELAGEEYAKINPGGKVPTMHDPNTDVQIYESGAIVLYLIEQYDTEKKLTYTDTKRKALLYQWLMFQMSQQGPYYGQVG